MAGLRNYSQSDFQKLNLEELEFLCRERRLEKVRNTFKRAFEKIHSVVCHSQSGTAIKTGSTAL